MLGTPIYYLILAGIFALGLLLMQAKTTFKKILSVVAWSGVATAIVGTIVFCASLFVRDTEGLDPSKPGAVSVTNLAAFLPTNIPKALASIAGSFDIFTIWFLVINGIYIGMHYYSEWKNSEDQRRKEKEIRSTGYTVKQGKQNILVGFDEILSFYAE